MKFFEFEQKIYLIFYGNYGVELYEPDVNDPDQNGRDIETGHWNIVLYKMGN